MFGIDFSEILVIFVIALVVLGPERLPKLAATVGRWIGRARSMARQFREQLEQEASRLQTETRGLHDEAKGLHDSLDLNAATRSAQDHPYSSQPTSAPDTGAAAAADSTPVPPEQPPHPESTSASSAEPAPAQEFGLHNAGAPEPAGNAEPKAHTPVAAPEERAVAVEAHER